MKTLTKCLLVLIPAMALGCGPGTVSVKGTVTLDGKPVEGATVTFSGTGANSTATGMTNAAGEFELSSGLAKGEYKVVVTKSEAMKGMGADGKAPDPKSDDYMKMMKGMASKSGAGGQPGMPPGMSKGPQSGPKSLLPEIYSKPDTTPLKVTIPADSITLELKSKP